MSNKIEVNLSTINDGIDYCILTGKSPIYPYENGKRIDDTPIGTRIEVILQGNRFKPLTVKLEGNNSVLSDVTDEQIENACCNLKLIPVKFSDCKIALYSINNNMVMTATATDCRILSNKKES